MKNRIKSLEKIREGKRYLVFSVLITLIFSIAIFSIARVSAFGESGSTAVFNVQYTNPFGAAYEPFMRGPEVQAPGEEFFDLQLFIPPAGCKPYVVRSDLLEEQNVPVFCQLAPLVINPGLDITRIDRISFAQAGNASPYIAGIGFYPAQAAIRSRGTLVNNPTSNNLGYVVVVLKRQPNEKAMPDNVTAVLSAIIEYGANYAFGLGQTVFYLPVMSDEEFANDYKSYGFFNGIGYLRVESIDENSAVISVYSSDNRKIFSDRIERGKTSKDFYLPTYSYANGARYSLGGQGVRVTLEDLTIPQTKARIIVNGETYDVYRGGRFYNDKCTLSSLEATGGGTGSVRVNCPGKTFYLEKRFNNVGFIIQGLDTSKKVGDYLSSEDNFDYYLAYVGQVPESEEAYVFIANFTKKDAESRDFSSEIKTIGRFIEGKVKAIDKKGGEFKKDLEKIKEYSSWSGKVGLIVLFSNSELKKIADIELKSVEAIDAPFIAENQIAEDYYKKALNSYDEVITRFGQEKNTGGSFEIVSWPETNQPYAADALWKEYYLAETLKQDKKKLEILSRIKNEYPNSIGSIDSEGKRKRADELFIEKSLLSSEGSSDYDEKENLYIELVSVTTPSKEEASVELTYTNSNTGKTESVIAGFNETFVNRIDDKIGDLRLTLTSFDEDKAYIEYYCSLVDKNEKKTHSGTKSVREKETLNIDECRAKVTINKINLKRVAKVRLTPIVQGRSRQTNFTFSIGIEKRPKLFQLTPEEANKKIASLNKKIANLKNITENLGKIVEGGKIACLATSGVLNLKNLVLGRTGEATARNAVMTMEGGWNDICERLVKEHPEKYVNFNDCIYQHEKDIKESIEQAKEVMKKIEDKEKSFAEQSKDKRGVNYDKVFENSVKDFKESLSSYSGIILKNPDGQDIDWSKEKAFNGKNAQGIISAIDTKKLDIGPTDLRELKYSLDMIRILPDNNPLKESYQKKAYNILSQVRERQGNREVEQQLSEKLSAPIYTVGNKQTEHIPYTPQTWRDFRSKYGVTSSEKVEIEDTDYVARVHFPLIHDIDYLVVLRGDMNQKSPSKFYKIKDKKVENLIDAELKNTPKNFVFDVYDETSFKNPCKLKDCGGVVKVFSLEPYKGMPSQMPFDSKEGWYIEARNLIPAFGTIKTYQESGRISSFYLANVGKNGILEGVGRGDDIYMMFNLDTGQPLNVFPGLKPEEAKKKVEQAIYWIGKAQEQLARNPSEIIINNIRLKVVGTSGITGSRCTDFMSPSDCKIIFNVCDPFVCPTSRCDLGGSYPVDNVIQSGIIGSTVLCLPNFAAFPGGDVYIPVCLTGINAGLEGLTSVLESYRDCLNQSVTTNKTVGICDEIWSVYVCDFFWRQAGPFVSAIIKNIFTGYLFGGGPRGGGEYAFTADAWSNAENAWRYFTTSYASNSKLMFGFRSIAEVGTEFCKMRLSATYPDKLGEALSPESPVQFHAWFDELPYTDATIPPTSQYKVFYHIYAGKDSGHYYQIYLKSPPEAIGYAGKTYSQLVASGYVAKGETASETKDFLDVSGYKELCVRIDAKEECGFKKVSTSFALNYAQDLAVKSQAEQRVTTEKECISGTPSVGALLTPNIQQAAEQVIAPELYSYGVIRVCASDDPGKGTADEGRRWKEVGYCDDPKIKCWIDQNSVKDAIKGKGIENKTIEEIDKLEREQLNEEGMWDAPKGKEEIKNLVKDYKSVLDKGEKLGKDLTSEEKQLLSQLDDKIEAIYSKLIFTSQKAQLMFLKAMIYDAASRAMFKEKKESAGVEGEGVSGGKISKKSGEGGEQKETQTSKTTDKTKLQCDYGCISKLNGDTKLGSRQLNIYSIGKDVGYLQCILFNLGYTQLGNVDCIYGEKTKSAVIDFQSKNSLNGDGIVGPETLYKLKKKFNERFSNPENFFSS